MEFWTEYRNGIKHGVVETSNGIRRYFSSQIIAMMLIDNLVFAGHLTEQEADEVYNWVFMIACLPVGDDGSLYDVELLPDFTGDEILEQEFLLDN